MAIHLFFNVFIVCTVVLKICNRLGMNSMFFFLFERRAHYWKQLTSNNIKLWTISIFRSSSFRYSYFSILLLFSLSFPAFQIYFVLSAFRICHLAMFFLSFFFCFVLLSFFNCFCVYFISRFLPYFFILAFFQITPSFHLNFIFIDYFDHPFYRLLLVPCTLIEHSLPLYTVEAA